MAGPAVSVVPVDGALDGPTAGDVAAAGSGIARQCERASGPWLRRREKAAVMGGLCIVLVASALMYFWRLGDWGWGYAYYSAAIEAGSQSFKAAVFGALDPHGLVTIDKGPAGLWPSEVAVRILGLSPWSVLGPYAAEGVATVGLVYATVARCAGRWAGLGAAVLMSVTPVAVSSFRFNNPDALLTLLSVAALYCALRSGASPGTRWAWLAGLLLGLGFLTKFLAVGMVVPAVVVALLAGRASRRSALMAVARAGTAAVLACGWWLALVSALPASQRPFVGGTQDDSIWSLVFGYDGFNRVTGTGFTGSAGSLGHAVWVAVLRLFGGQMGAQVAWLLPAALLLLVAGLASGPARSTPGERVSLLTWGTWLVVGGAILSSGQGLINAYYTVLLAPAVAALVAVGARVLVRQWASSTARLWAACIVAVSGVWAFDLFDRERGWAPWLRFLVLALSLVVAVVLVARERSSGRVRAGLAVATACVGLAGPVAYAIGTATGPVPSTDPMATLPGPSGVGPVGPRGGGVTSVSRPSRALVRALEAEPSSSEWVVAVVGGDPAAGYQLATGRAAMAIGGWRGTDPVPTLRRFEGLVRAGRIGYFVPASPSDGVFVPKSEARTPAGLISAWVSSHFASTTIGGQQLFDLRLPSS